MSDIELPKLPDTRSTQRLLNIMHQLEKHLANAAAFGNEEVSVDSELGRLRLQNKQLKRRQRDAIDRLDALMERLDQQPQTKGEAA